MRLCGARRSVLLVAVVLSGLANAGCSYRLGSLFGNDAPEHTGSAASPAPATAAALPPEGDLAVAKQAATDALSRLDKDAAMPWENPATGARGTVTPLTSAYTVDGMTCRDFLASYVRDGKESWLQGGACRARRGPWEIRDLRPWKRS